jgi:ribose transport system permease protein
MTSAKRLLPAVSLFLLCVFFAVRVPQATGHQSFLTLDNLFGIAGQYAYLLLISMGATMVIIAGGIDLSVGSVLALSGVTAAYLMVKSGLPTWAGMLAGTLLGALCGTLTGLIVTKLKVPAFIASLGMLLVARGVALRIAKGVTVDGTPDSFNTLSSARPLGLPMPLLLIIILALLVAFVLHYTKFGRYLYAIGSNPEAARVSGVNVARIQLGVYALGGAIARGSAQATRRAGRATSWMSSQPSSSVGQAWQAVRAVSLGRFLERCSSRCYTTERTCSASIPLIRTSTSAF